MPSAASWKTSETSTKSLFPGGQQVGSGSADILTDDYACELQSDLKRVAITPMFTELKERPNTVTVMPTPTHLCAQQIGPLTRKSRPGAKCNTNFWLPYHLPVTYRHMHLIGSTYS